VATEYSGRGDPARSIELMWGVQDRPRRGPKPRLTVEQVVQTAIRVADADGLAALSMRRVADELSVTAMSLYTYVPGKAELLDLMLDRVCAETAKPVDVPGGWRARLELVARENFALYQRHPWMLQVGTSRPSLGPNLVAKYDYELRAVAGLGLTEIEMDQLVTLAADYVYGAVRSAVEAAQVEKHTGQTDQQWWESYAPALEKVLDPERYPLAATVGAAAGEAYGAAADPARAFDFGLQRVLDGIEAFIQTRRSSPPHPADRAEA